VVICLERGADLHTAQMMPLPLTVSCSRKIQIGFIFLVLTHPGIPGKRALKLCVCVCVCVYSAPVSRCVGERRPIIDELRRLRPDDNRTTPSRRQRFHGRRPDRPHRVQAWTRTDSSSAIAGFSVSYHIISYKKFILRQLLREPGPGCIKKSQPNAKNTTKSTNVKRLTKIV